MNPIAANLRHLDVLTTCEAAAVLQIGEKQLRRLCAVKRLRHVKIDGRGTLRFRRQWIEEYLERAAPQVKP
jgi:excisionase family DNA binding protein